MYATEICKNDRCQFPDAGGFAHDLVRSVELGVRSVGALCADYKASQGVKKLNISDSLASLCEA